MKNRTHWLAFVGLFSLASIASGLGSLAIQGAALDGPSVVTIEAGVFDDRRTIGDTDELTVQETDSGVEVFHSYQPWRTSFDGDGFLTRPVVQDSNRLAWSWGLALEAYGFGTDRAAVAEFGCLNVDENRVAYDWNSNLQEWYVFDARGMEHGYTLQSRPIQTGSKEGSLVFDLRVRGTLLGEVYQGGQGVRFLDANGVCILTYSGLHVFDANGVSQPATIEGGGAALSMVIDDSNAQYPLTIDPIAQSAYIKASNPGAFDRFGSAVAVWNDLLVVGAPYEDSASGGVNGNGLDNSLDDAGAAYLYSRTGGVWSQVAYLKAPMPAGPVFVRNFGRSVAVDNGRVVVASIGGAGVSQGGGAYVFENVAGQWVQTAFLAGSATGSNQVAMSGDRVVVGSPSSNQYVYSISGGTWILEGTLMPFPFAAGFGGSIDIEGETIVIGAGFESSVQPDSGAAYVYELIGGAWAMTETLKASNPGNRDLFGRFVAISNGRIGIGAEWEDSITQGVNGDDGDDGRPDSGAVYVFEKVGGAWSQQAILKAANAGQNDQFGWVVAMHGDRLAVSATDEDSSSTGINGAAHLNDASNSGAVYLFSNAGGVWSQDAYLKRNPASLSYAFSNVRLALSESSLLIGTEYDSSSSTGINGDPSDMGALGSGSAFLYDLEASYGSYCGTAVPNSSGDSATVSHTGSILIADNALTLEVSGQPIGVFGYFISSQGTTVVPMAGGGQGTRCLGGGAPIGRHFASLQNSGAQGSMSYTLNLTSFPGPNGPVTILSGATWHFQNWFRDNNPTPTSNFSDGLSIQFE